MSIGAFNGIAVGYLGMIPFVVTLAMMTVTNGAAVWLTGSISIADVPDVFVDPFFARYFGIAAVGRSSRQSLPALGSC